VKVLDIDRDRQRISLGLKQTQEDPWERVVNTYNVGDVLEGKVTKVVSFGAFVEIMEGVEGLVHISELAQHHVENPREIVDPGDTVKVKILEIDDERRRLSLSLKRVEGQVLPMREIASTDGDQGAEAGEEMGDGGEVPDLDLSEEVFAGEEPQTEAEPEALAEAQPEAQAEAQPEAQPEAAAEPAADQLEAEPEAEQVQAVPEAEQPEEEAPAAEAEEEAPAAPEPPENP
jgi:small subunit ribosomal protein S1